GIRDKLVTGVQTCALPICQRFHHRRDVLSAGGEAVDVDERQRRRGGGGGVVPQDGLGEVGPHVRVCRFALAQIAVEVGNLRDVRSEERRVGKACIGRRARG